MKKKEIKTVPAWQAFAEVCDSITTESSDTYPRIRACAHIIEELFDNSKGSQDALEAFTLATHRVCLARCDWVLDVLDRALEQGTLFKNGDATIDKKCITEIFVNFAPPTQSEVYFQTMLEVVVHSEMGMHEFNRVRDVTTAVGKRLKCTDASWYVACKEILHTRIRSNRDAMRAYRKCQKTQTPTRFLSGQEGATA